MFRRLGSIVVWQYSPTASVGLLHRHRRIGILIIKAAMLTALLMMESIFECMLSSPGWWRNVLVWIACVSALFTLPLWLLTPPACLLVQDIERELAKRGEIAGCVESLDRRMGKTAMRMLLLFFAIMVAVRLRS